MIFFFFSSRRRHTRWTGDWSSDVCSSDLLALGGPAALPSRARAANGPRIVIVGGGIAGLTAALTLQDKGVSSEIYESSGRLGGRMHSDWTEFGRTFWANG